MGCGCGKSGDPKPVSKDAPNPNQKLPQAWWQANPAPAPAPAPAVPMPQ